MMGIVIKIIIACMVLLVICVAIMPFVKTDKRQELLDKVAFGDVIALICFAYFSLIINIIDRIKA